MTQLSHVDDQGRVRMVDTGQLGIVGAYYELVSGRVMFSDMVKSGTPAARRTEQH